jgi:trimeric autotransporter adhesin
MTVRLGFAASLLFLFLFLSSAFRLGAQDAPASPQTPPTGTAAGVVRTSEGVGVPGATLRLVETASGRAWVTWTDENGHFDLPALPQGHYRIEVSQLGFDDATQEFDLGGTPAAVNVPLKVASLQSLETTPAPATAQNAAPAAGAAAPGNGSENPAAAPNSNTQAPNQSANQNPRRGRGQGYGAGAGGGGFGRRQFPGGGAAPGAGQNGAAAQAPSTAGAPAGQGGAFQQVLLNNQNAAAGEEEPGLGAEGGAPNEGALGQAASSDAVLMNGTVGQGDQNAGFAGAPPPGGIQLQGPGQAGQNGFGGTGGNFQGGAPSAQPGGAATPGLPGGGFGGPGGFGGGGGGGGRGGGPPAARGGGGGGRQGQPARAPQQGVAALWGMQRVIRQRINRVRASFYNQYGNSAFDARPYSITQANPPKIGAWTEQIGGNLGGPLVIPHLYDGRDKTFFFLNFDSTWARNAVDQFSTVPTAAERGGNFCGLSPQPQLYLPNSGGSAVCQIPSSMLNSASLGLLQYIPLPNVPGSVDNFHLQTSVPTQQDRFNARLLQTISPKLNARLIYALSDSSNHAFQSFPDLESDVSTLGQSVTAGLTENLSRQWINDSQLIFSRSRVQTLDNFAFSQNVAGDLGITGVSTAPIDWELPSLSFNNFTRVAPAAPSLVRNQTYRFVDAVTYMLPKHTVTFGAEVRRIQNNTDSDQTPEGLFTFSGLETSLIGPTGQAVSGTGLDFADFLLGDPYSTNERFGTPASYFRSWGTVGYVSDDWRARSDFTLQFGARYEFFTPPTELYGHLSNLDYDPATQQVALVIPGEAGPFSGALPSGLIRPNYNHWSPRIGLAWRPPIKSLQANHSMVVRAGYGLFYNESIYTQLLSELANQPPWSNSQLRISSPGDLLTLQDGFPSTVAAQNTVQNTYAVNPNYKVGYAQIWNLSVETNIAPNTALVLTYTGTKGSDLDMLFAPNRPAPGSLTPTGPIANAADFIYDTSGANSIYNSLQVRLQKRLTHGIMINGTYTYGKSMDDASSIGGGTPIVVQDANNLRAEYGLSSFDIRQTARINYLYELPFGQGHRFAQKGWVGGLFGDWRFSGNIGVQTGTPFTAEVSGTSAGNTGSGGVFATRADQICNPNAGGSGAPLDFFNTSCFVVPPAGQLGDASRNTIEGPGMFVWNAQFAKTFTLGRDRQHRLDLRWEVTNLTNTPHFTGLSTLVNSTTFGEVTGAGNMRMMDIVTRFTF